MVWIIAALTTITAILAGGTWYVARELCRRIDEIDRRRGQK